MIGQTIGQYRVIERLGSGGMGSVYRGVDELLGRDVALKVLDTADAGAASRFRAEAAALGRLTHPGVAAMYDLIEDNGRLVMAMELVRGQTLQHVLEHVGAFAPDHAARLCIEALAILEHAHAIGIVHRDLKPGNLMIGESGALRVLDFGIARVDGAINLTHAGMMLGTPAYMAPEQVLGHPVDARADLYAMGVLFFRLVTDALPFSGETPFDMAQAQVHDEPAHAAMLRPGLPAWVDDIVSRALAKKPVDRFQSAAEFRDALARAIASPPYVAASAAIESTEAMPRPDQPLLLTRPTPQPQPPRPQGPQPNPLQQPTANGLATVRRRRARLLIAAAAIVVAGTWAPIGLLRWSVEEIPVVTGPRQPAVEELSPDAAIGPPPAPVNAVLAVPVAAPPRPLAATVSPDRPARPSASFRSLKLLIVQGARTSAVDAVVNFSDDEVSVESAAAGGAPLTMPYRGLAKATYAHARDPEWDRSLHGPVGKIDVPGVLGRSRHWLVLQGVDRYLILRLDGDDRAELMKSFEERAGFGVQRAAGGRH